MSPVERRSSSSTTTAVVVALAGVVAGLGLVFFMVNLASQGGEGVEINLGDERFPAGPAADRADSIDEGGPLLFADAASGDRDIILHHLGDDPSSGWHAIGAAPPGKPRDCVLQWQPDDEVFEDCDGETYPPDGEGLTTYPVVIEDEQLHVDINAEFRDEGDGDDEEEGGVEGGDGEDGDGGEEGDDGSSEAEAATLPG